MSYRLDDLRGFELYYGTEIINILKALCPFQDIYVLNEADGSISKFPTRFAERKLIGRNIYITGRNSWASLSTDKFGIYWGLSPEDLK